MLRANIGNIEHRSSESIYTSIHLSIDEKAQSKKSASFQENGNQSTLASYHLIAFECLQRLWCFEFTACNLFARELWLCNVQCEIDCSKTVKIVAWVICSRMAELCTAQSCMANFILIHQTTVQCVVCYSNYNCAILWNAAPLSTMLQPKDKAETVIQHPTTFHFHFLTQDWSTSSNFLIIFHVHTFSDPIWCSDGKFFLFGQNVLLGKVVKQLQGLF